MIDCMKYLSMELSNLLINSFLKTWMHSYYWKDVSITFYPCLNILDFSVCYADLSYICLQYTAHEFYFQSSAMALGSNGHMQMRSFCVLPNSFFGLYVIDRISSFPLMISIGMAAVARSEAHSTSRLSFYLFLIILD